MNIFDYHQNTQIVFGCNRLEELGELASPYGRKALLVTTNTRNTELIAIYDKVKKRLADAGVEVVHYDGVVPNPTVACVSEGSTLARKNHVDFIVGLGGGSSIDVAKAISVEATHQGSCWDYLYFKDPQPQTEKLLPVMAISTTSGSGSHVTQVAVITNEGKRDKSALYHSGLFPKIAIVDPELCRSVPKFVTACTGFDVFCHAFESVLHPKSGLYVELLAWEAMAIVLDTLPKLLKDLENTALRERMAWADTLAGLCIANSGVTLPHGMAMAIGGMYPHIAHGEALSIIYPVFARFTGVHAQKQFARLALLFDGDEVKTPISDQILSIPEKMALFLKEIGLEATLGTKGVPKDELPNLARQCMVLPDYKANPKVPNEREILHLLELSY